MQQPVRAESARLLTSGRSLSSRWTSDRLRFIRALLTSHELPEFFPQSHRESGIRSALCAIGCEEVPQLREKILIAVGAQIGRLYGGVLRHPTLPQNQARKLSLLDPPATAAYTAFVDKLGIPQLGPCIVLF